LRGSARSARQKTQSHETYAPTEIFNCSHVPLPFAGMMRLEFPRGFLLRSAIQLRLRSDHDLSDIRMASKWES
jgi:hypothetical protein